MMKERVAVVFIGFSTRSREIVMVLFIAIAHVGVSVFDRNTPLRDRQRERESE
jgi:hypothetical protein